MPSTDAMEQSLRNLLEAGDLPQPDEIEHRDDGSIVALWHDRKLAVVVDPDGPRA